MGVAGFLGLKVHRVRRVALGFIGLDCYGVQSALKAQGLGLVPGYPNNQKSTVVPNTIIVQVAYLLKLGTTCLKSVDNCDPNVGLRQ